MARKQNASYESFDSVRKPLVTPTAQYIKTPQEAGYETDQYGNFIHGRNDVSDYFCVKANDGTIIGRLYFESGALEAVSKSNENQLIALSPGNGNLTIKGVGTADNTFDSTNTKITFSSRDGSQVGQLIFTYHDAVAPPVALTLVSNDSTGNAYFITPKLWVTNTSDASGTSETWCPMIVGDKSGYHLEFDKNEVMAKQNGTTVSELHLNENGGNVYINQLRAARVPTGEISIPFATFSGILTNAKKYVRFFVPIMDVDSNATVSLEGNYYIFSPTGTNVLYNASLDSIGTVTYTIFKIGIRVGITLTTASTLTNNIPLVVQASAGATLNIS